jgi:hypothetical protein
MFCNVLFVLFVLCFVLFILCFVCFVMCFWYCSYCVLYCSYCVFVCFVMCFLYCSYNSTSCSPSPSFGRSVTDFCSWDAHEAQLRCPDGVSDDMCERGVPGGALNLSYTSHSDHGRRGDIPLQGKIPTAETEIEPGTSSLVVRKCDHQATRLVIFVLFVLFYGVSLIFYSCLFCLYSCKDYCYRMEAQLQ